MAIIYEKRFTHPNEKVVRQFTNCCGASDKGTEYGIVCRGCYEPIEGYMADGDDSPEEFENLIHNKSVLKEFREFVSQEWNTYMEWHDSFIEKLMTNRKERKNG